MKKAKIESEELLQNLEYFKGYEMRFHLPLVNTSFTSGVRHLSEAADCFWLVADASTIAKSLMNRSEFVTIDFKMLSEEEQDFLGYAAVLEYKDRNGHKLESHKYHIEDFPLDEVCLYFTNNTLMLPSEY